MDKNSYPKLSSIKLKNHSNVAILPVMTKIDLPADRILITALNEKLKNVVVIGEFEDGSTYHAATQANMGEIFLALDRMKRHLLEILDGQE